MLLDGLRRMIIRNILILTVIAALVPTAMSNVSASAAAEIALFSGVSDSDGLSISGNGDTAKMELKATNDNGKTNKVSNYQMNADNVLYIKVGDKVTVEDNVDFTKAITTDGNNNQKAIGITSNGVIDFTGYAQGVSTLDVVVDDDRAYEAVIVIGEHNQDTVKKEITTVTVCEGVIDNQTGACIQDPEPCDEGFVPEGDECVPEPPIPCDEGFVPEGDECVPEPPIPCDEGFVLEGDECVPEPPIPCDEGFVLEGDECVPELTNPVEPIGMCFDGATPVDGKCPTPDPSTISCLALGCPGSPPAEPLGPIEVKPIAIVDELPAEEDEIPEEEQQDYAEEDDESGSSEDEDVEESDPESESGSEEE